MCVFVVMLIYYHVFFFFFKQKTAYEIKECDWSSDVCSSDLGLASWGPHDFVRSRTDSQERELLSASNRSLPGPQSWGE